MSDRSTEEVQQELRNLQLYRRRLEQDGLRTDEIEEKIAQHRNALKSKLDELIYEASTNSKASKSR